MAKLEKAYLALGCFWGPDEYFSRLPGIVKTQVGYSGGKTPAPDYHNIGDHSETIEIEFDPEIITYPEILRHFFSQHNPTKKEIQQYRSVIFYLNKNQEKSALEVKKNIEKELSQSILTSIEPFSKFFRAEEYHQKYFQKIKNHDQKNQ